MKTLVFPDLHESPQALLDRIENLIAAEGADRVVFLGDYFDRYHDTPADAERMAQWLAAHLDDPRRTHLIGNHDASYLWPVETTFCPGFTWEKEAVIRATLGPNARDRFVFHAWVDGWLLTHAGLSAQWMTVPVDLVATAIAAEEKAARLAFGQDTHHWFVTVGQKRGGPFPAGGILWCDHRELEPIPGLRQIYGHTPGSQPRWIGRDHLCLDTNVGHGPQHYVAIEDGAVRIQALGS